MLISGKADRVSGTLTRICVGSFAGLIVLDRSRGQRFFAGFLLLTYHLQYELSGRSYGGEFA